MCMNIINVDEVQKEDSLDVVGVSDKDIDDWESAMHLVAIDNIPSIISILAKFFKLCVQMGGLFPFV